jgi:hypothetical protein
VGYHQRSFNNVKPGAGFAAHTGIGGTKSICV